MTTLLYLLGCASAISLATARTLGIRWCVVLSLIAWFSVAALLIANPAESRSIGGGLILAMAISYALGLGLAWVIKQRRSTGNDAPS